MKRIILSLTLLLGFIGLAGCSGKNTPDESRILSYTADPAKQEIRLYWKNEEGQIFGSLQNIKNYFDSHNKKLLFAMNAGMFHASQSPVGLYIENYEMWAPLNTENGRGNFFMKPNGVFYLTDDNQAIIVRTDSFRLHSRIQYATQSGPMLVINGQINPAFKKGSDNVNIRNGVGILPDNRVLFALAKEEINLYDFAEFFKKAGCRQALYLDGLISRAYVPEQNWLQTDGEFGVLITVTDKPE